MVNKSKKTVLPLLVIISAIIFTGLIGAIITILPAGGETATNTTYEAGNFTHLNVVDKDIMLYLPFDIPLVNNKIYDYSSYENDGTQTNSDYRATSISGVYGNALKFDGTNDRYDLPNNVPKNSSDVSISMWINVTNTSFSNAIMLLCYDYTSYSGLKINGPASNGTFRFGLGRTGYGFHAFPFSNNNWYHVVFTHTGTNSTLYVNGVFNQSLITKPLFCNHTADILGRDDNTAFYKGVLDELIIFNKTLTPTEVNQIYTSTYPIFEPTGTMLFQNNNLGQGNIVNLTFPNCQALNGSFIQAKINNGDYVNFTGCSLNSYDVSDSLTYANVTIKLNSNPFKSYSPTPFGNLTLNSYRTSTMIKGNFTTSVGILNDYFYGVNTHGRFLTNWTKIDTDLTGSLDSMTDYKWHQQYFEDTEMNIVRVDAFLYAMMPTVNTFRRNYASWDRYNNVETVRSTVQYMAERGGMTMIILEQMPVFAQNRSSIYCTSSDSYTSCPTNDTVLWETAIKNFLYEVTWNGLYNDSVMVEVWNEPYASSWLSGYSFGNGTSNGTAISTDAQIRATEYVKLFNSTYTTIKSVYPNMKVCGPSGGGGGTHTPNLFRTFLENASDYGYDIDCLTVHPYADTGNNYYQSNQLTVDLAWIYANCTAYSVDCPHIIMGEWNDINSTMKNLSWNWDDYKSSNAFAYMSMMNSYPTNISSIFYQWSEVYDHDYASYPQRAPNGGPWSMVSEPRLDNLFYPSYNVTRQMSRLCSPGSTIYRISDDDIEVQEVMCQKGSVYSIIILNNGTSQKNITANLSLTNGSVFYPYSSLMNYETGASIPVSTQGIIQLGVLGSHETLYLYSGLEDGADLRGVFKLDEGSGNTIYDSLQNLSNGVKSGATWKNDGVLVTLSEGVDYTINLATGLLTLDTDYLYEYLFIDYNYNKIFGFHVSILNVIAGFLMIVVLGVAIIYVVKYFKNIKELE